MIGELCKSRRPIAVSDNSSLYVFVWSDQIRSKSKEQLNDRRALEQACLCKSPKVTTTVSHGKVQVVNISLRFLEHFFPWTTSALCVVEANIGLKAPKILDSQKKLKKKWSGSPCVLVRSKSSSGIIFSSGCLFQGSSTKGLIRQGLIWYWGGQKARQWSRWMCVCLVGHWQWQQRGKAGDSFEEKGRNQQSSC